MERSEALEIVIETLRAVSRYDLGNSITERTNPSADLGLESYDGILAAPRLEERFGVVVPPGLNPLVDDKHRRMRRVGEIADFMLEVRKSRTEKSHA